MKKYNVLVFPCGTEIANEIDHNTVRFTNIFSHASPELLMKNPSGFSGSKKEKAFYKGKIGAFVQDVNGTKNTNLAFL